MKRAGQRASPWFVLLAIPVLLTGSLAFAENIDPNNNGSQYAWAENLGWIDFQPSGPGANRSCAGSSYGVMNDAAGTNVLLTWIAVSGATPFDIVRGGLSVLRSTNGNFQTAIHPRIVNDTTNTCASTGGDPSAGDGYWFLVRGSTCGGAGTYDDGTQVASRDAEINAPGNRCP